MAPTQTPIWREIAEDIRNEIALGRYGPHEKLPTETQLAGRFGVNRHTVRRAIAELTRQRILHPRRGVGVFVLDRTGCQAPGGHVKHRLNIWQRSGILETERLATITRGADPQEAASLDLEVGGPVLVHDGICRFQGMPAMLFRKVIAPLPGLAEALATCRSVAEALAACGMDQTSRTAVRISAVAANATQALHLRINEGDPLVTTSWIDIDPDLRPAVLGTTCHVGERIELDLSPAL